MKKLIIKLIVLFSMILCASCNYAPISPFAEIPDPSLPEIAMIRADPNWGTVVIYNPDTCIKIGEACGFFRLHAYAHRHLNHTLLATPSAYPVSQETQADCWAAKYGKSNEVFAATKLLLAENRDSKIKLHGDLNKRAENIQNCATQAGKWREN